MAFRNEEVVRHRPSNRNRRHVRACTCPQPTDSKSTLALQCPGRVADAGGWLDHEPLDELRYSAGCIVRRDASIAGNSTVATVTVNFHCADQVAHNEAIVIQSVCVAKFARLFDRKIFARVEGEVARLRGWRPFWVEAPDDGEGSSRAHATTRAPAQGQPAHVSPHAVAWASAAHVPASGTS